MTLDDLLRIFIIMAGSSILLLLPLVVIMLRKIMCQERRVSLDAPVTPRTTNAHWRPTVSDWHTRRMRAMEK